jgi:hypothetical protein
LHPDVPAQNRTAPVPQSAGANRNRGFTDPNRGFTDQRGAANPQRGINPQQGGATVVRGGRRYIGNPVFRGPAWGWNRGNVWAPQVGYWGGGFWGGFAIGSGLFFGSLVDNGVTYNSYQINDDSPGATLLENYHLQQTQCGPPDLVEIYGPDNSVICAYPNDIVDAGEYTLDPSTLTIVSM